MGIWYRVKHYSSAKGRIPSSVYYSVYGGIARSGKGLDGSDRRHDRRHSQDYASTPLLILTLALVKWSLCAFVQHITPDSSHLRINSWLLVLAGLWAASAIIVSLFQCALPTPWYYIDIERCVDRRAWWAYVAVLNMATEIGTVVLYFLMFWNLPISHSRKALVLTVFSSRTLLVAAIAVQLVAFRGAYPSPDIMATLWLPVIYDQVVICLSVATACMPYLKPFMEKLEADVVRVENFGLRRRVIWE
ncbi:hypothetical protein GGR54DRAFT_589432 [Hypoxylon sp. NC1633]|nr:hypothetical protein GGR54DRAFT_589432 [Hypoxylon sp. NC1633]